MNDDRGFVDLHNHQFANLAFGGGVLWGSAGGDVEQSLSSCRPEHGPHGLRDLPGSLAKITLRTGSISSLLGHRTGGNPDFTGWPRWDDVTHQTVHQSCLKRAVDGGLRLIVILAVNSELLGRLTGATRYGDMDAVDQQLQAAKDLESAIDAEAGGPGRGWYRIVYTPDEARRVIAGGRLAVVLGIEVDRLFGDTIGAGSTAGDLAVEVERYHALGVRHVLPIHLKDNTYGGAAFALNLHWSRQGGPISRANPPFSLPVFRMDTVGRADAGYGYRGARCNRRGLTPLGRDLIRLFMRHGMMIDVDHMSAASRADTLQLAQPGYPVIAGHAEIAGVADASARSERLLTDEELHAIAGLGGMVAPLLRQMSVSAANGPQGGAKAFVAAYRHVLRQMPGSPVGLGTDFNGFAGLPRPDPDGTGRVEYPFGAPAAGSSLGRSTLGTRTFDINTDGVAHAGMLPDFIAELRAIGLSDEECAPLLGSARGYVDAWERAAEAR